MIPLMVQGLANLFEEGADEHMAGDNPDDYASDEDEEQGRSKNVSQTQLMYGLFYRGHFVYSMTMFCSSLSMVAPTYICTYKLLK